MKEPRVNKTQLHKLEDILFIAISSVLSSVEIWNEMEIYGGAKQLCGLAPNKSDKFSLR